MESRIAEEKIGLFLLNFYGIVVESSNPLESGIENDNIHIISTDVNEYVFKRYRVKSEKEALVGLKILEYLNNKDFASPRVIRSKKNKIIELFEGKPCAVLTYHKGTMLTHLSKYDLPFVSVGSLLGDFHTKVSGLDLQEEKQSWDFEGIKTLLEQYSVSIIDKGFPQGAEETTFIKGELAQLVFPKSLPYGVTHQDVKPENIIENDGEYILIDFDNAYSGILLFDILTPVIWTCFENEKLNPVAMQAIIQGYEQHRRLTIEEKQSLKDALKFRLLREAFIWMWLYNTPETHERSQYFLRLYKNL